MTRLLAREPWTPVPTTIRSADCPPWYEAAIRAGPAPVMRRRCLPLAASGSAHQADATVVSWRYPCVIEAGDCSAVADFPGLHLGGDTLADLLNRFDRLAREASVTNSTVDSRLMSARRSPTGHGLRIDGELAAHLGRSRTDEPVRNRERGSIDCRYTLCRRESRVTPQL